MSHQKIDKLFKERLRDLEQAPSAEAWTKLEGMLANNKKKVFYFRLKIAAAITFLLLSGWVIWSSQRSLLQQEEMPISNIEPLMDNTLQNGVAKVEKDVISEPNQTDNSEVKTKNRNKLNLPKQSNGVLVSSNDEIPTKAIDTLGLKSSQETLVAENKPLDEELKKQVNETLPPVMIIYKQNTSEAVVQAKETTNEKVTWDAVVAVAKDFKQGNLNLTSRLKEAKEDLFALRFTNKNKDNSK